jgi:D-alanyl-D-alanine carboxypeptidase
MDLIRRVAFSVALATLLVGGCAAREPRVADPAAPSDRSTPASPPGSPATASTYSAPKSATAAPAPDTPSAPALGAGGMPAAGAAGTPFASDRLSRELDDLFSASTLQTAVVGALVQSLDTGEVLYRRSADTLLVPASNMKIATIAAAAVQLGWNFRYVTTLETTAPVAGGVLAGDLFVVGGGRSDDQQARRRSSRDVPRVGAPTRGRRREAHHRTPRRRR